MTKSVNDFLVSFEKSHFLNKNSCGYFSGQMLQKNWATFYSIIWSHCQTFSLSFEFEQQEILTKWLQAFQSNSTLCLLRILLPCQCDQVWRNFATWATTIKVFGNSWRICLVLGKKLTLHWLIFMLLGKCSML